jgi:hypothetical protein
MRLISRNEHIVDNVVQSQFEMYRNGTVIGVARYQMRGDRIVFMLCQTTPACSRLERRSFYLAAVRDAHHRHLRIDITSRSRAEELRVPRAERELSLTV